MHYSSSPAQINNNMQIFNSLFTYIKCVVSRGLKNFLPLLATGASSRIQCRHSQVQSAFLPSLLSLLLSECAKQDVPGCIWALEEHPQSKTAHGITALCVPAAKPLLQAVIFLKFTANAISAWQLLPHASNAVWAKLMGFSSGVRRARE